jgi:hypothetical protein
MLPAIQPVSISAQALVPERPLLVHHVARMTGLCERAIRWNARRGFLKGFRQTDTPKIWRFWRRDVEAFIAWRNHVLQAN